ncbi:Csu type fimbrial protein [Methylococcus capsulatus]|uniref:Csu type fimbrial protein n=1 Tax=Methylococcus capsulatus TaxID=414 RepID=UPI001C52EB20|nr:spore coat U domain-containing protein [Methylococcus capsulatus]QXP88860.1 spore coat U domain-containing protein [Methylococcus capsulatus]
MNTLSKHAFLRRTAGFASLAIAFFLAGPGTAKADASASLNVTATVASKCKINSTTTGLSFGDYDPTDTTDATANNGQIQVKCTKGSTHSITMGPGTGTGANCTGTPVRYMKQGTDQLQYALYQDSGFSTVWGCTTGTGGNAYSYSASSNGYSNITVYGKIPAEQDVPAGSYSDTVTVTVVF